MAQQNVSYNVTVTVSPRGATVVVRSAEDEVLWEETYTVRELALVRHAVNGNEQQARERLASFTVGLVLQQQQQRTQAQRDALERRLQEAVADEDYELAARLRNRLSQLDQEGT
ncbi:MAG TPA: hypothetical protein EYP85_16215 [Armatimonadetes bacterium]|nr:hypothetical protein [Armatimonadota bacterium]